MRLHHRLEGPEGAPVLVCSNSIGTTLELWAPQAAAFAVSFRLLRYAACCDALARWDFRGELGSVSAPALVLAGAEDPATPPEQVAAIAEAIPGARLIVLEGAAHLLNVERPAAFNRAVLDHLRVREQV